MKKYSAVVIVSLLFILLLSSSSIKANAQEGGNHETVIPNPAAWFWEVPTPLHNFLEQLYLTVYYFQLPSNMAYLLEGIFAGPTPTLATYTTPTPTSTQNAQCGGSCSLFGQGCPNGQSCSNGICILTACLNSTTQCDASKCTILNGNEPTATPTGWSSYVTPTNTPALGILSPTPTSSTWGGQNEVSWDFNGTDLGGWTVLDGKNLAMTNGYLTVYPDTDSEFPQILIYNPRFKSSSVDLPKVNLSMNAPTVKDNHYGSAIFITLKTTDGIFKHFSANQFNGEMIDDTSLYLSKDPTIPYPGQTGIWVYVNNVQFGTPVMINSITVH